MGLILSTCGFVIAWKLKKHEELLKVSVAEFKISVQDDLCQPQYTIFHVTQQINILGLGSVELDNKCGLPRPIYQQGRWWSGHIFTYLLTYLLTPCSRVLLDKLTGSAASQEIPCIFGTWKFITVLTSARHLSLSWADSIQSSQPPPTSWRSILILSSHLRLGLPNGLFPSGFPHQNPVRPSPLPHARHMPRPSHSSRFYHPHNIR